MLKTTDLPDRVATKRKELAAQEAAERTAQLTAAAEQELSAEDRAESQRQLSAQAAIDLDDLVIQRDELLAVWESHLTQVAEVGEELRAMFARMRACAALARKANLVVPVLQPWGLKKSEQNLRRAALSAMGSKL